MHKYYKGSQFNLLIDEKFDEVVIFNTFSGSVCCLEKDVWNTICNNKVNETCKYFNELKEQGLIVPSDVDQVGMIQYNENLAKFADNRTNLSFVIAPTLKCNLRCYYCFESNQNDTLIASDEMLDSTINFIESMMNNETKSLHINWFGGEPMLAYDFILKFSDRIKQVTSNHNIKYTSAMISNGVFLTKEKAKILKERCNLNRVQITLDGTRDEYCKRKGTVPKVFDTVIKNIIDCSDILDINIRLNCDRDNYNDLLTVIDQLFKNNNLSNHVKVYLAPIGDFNKKGIECFSNDEFSEYKIKFDNYIQTNYPEHVLQTKELKPRTCYCGLKRNTNYAIGPQGEIYTCEHDLGINEKVVGDIKNGLYYTEYHKKFLELNLSDKCKMCKLLPLCLGGCPSVRYNSGKEECCINERMVKYLVLKKLNNKN